MKSIIVFLLFVSLAYSQTGKKGMSGVVSLGTPGISKVQNTAYSGQYALNITNGAAALLGGTAVYGGLFDLDADGNSNLHNSTTTLGLLDSTKGYYYFDSAYVANTSNDSTTEDLSGHGNNGTRYGSFSWSSESRIIGGTSLYFNGNSYIQLPSQNITSSFTADLWFKIGTIDPSQKQMMILGQHPDGADCFYVTISNEGTIFFKVASVTPSVLITQILTNKSYNDNKWHYLACVFNAGSTLQFYIDGELYASTPLTSTTVTNTGGMFIGELDGNNSFGRFNGWMQEFRLTRRGLTAAEIKNHYNNFTEDYTIWTPHGTHTITSDASNHYDGTYGGKIVSTGVGDGTSNYVSLTIPEPLVAGYKYMVEVNTKTTYDVSKIMTIQIGSQADTIHLATSWVKKNYHLKSVGGEDFRVYLNKADTSFIDYIRIKKVYDFLFLSWNKSNGVGVQENVQTIPYTINFNSSNIYNTLLDEYGTNLTLDLIKPYNISQWNLMGNYIDWTANCATFLNTNAQTSTSHQALGSLSIPFTTGGGLALFYSNPFQFVGQAGAIAIYRFDDISLSNFNLTNLVNSSTAISLANITGGGSKLEAYWDFAGDTTNYILNKSPYENNSYRTLNNLTPYFIPMSSQVKIGTPYNQCYSVPSVTTSTSSSVGKTTATIGGNITSQGGGIVVAKGVCYGLTPSPDTSGNHILCGADSGSFTASLTGLSAITTYYYRAYAVNALGINYGGDSTFVSGDSLGVDLMAGYDFTNGWTTANATIINSTSFITIVSGGDIYKDIGMNTTAGTMYKVHIVGTFSTGATQFRIRDVNKNYNYLIESNATFDDVFWFHPASKEILIWVAGSATGTINITTCTIQIEH